jgi:hypothetical protein
LSTNDYTDAEKNKVTANENAIAALLDRIAYLENKVIYNGHEYVDLGLPSGTKWATMNVGATSETDYGNYYMYGMGSKTYDSTDTPYSGTEDPLDSSVDTASQVWGGSWHTPTETQMKELRANTTYQWVTNYKGSGINVAHSQLPMVLFYSFLLLVPGTMVDSPM